MPKYSYTGFDHIYVLCIVNTYMSVQYPSEEGRYTFIYYLNVIESTVVIIFHHLKLLKHVKQI